MRKQEVYQKSIQILKEGENPSVRRLSQETGFSVPDVHRCLNALEKEGRLRSRKKEVFGKQLRMVEL